MVNNSLVSVVIPTYKRPNMIGRAIESILSQTYNNLEIIVVDDNGKGAADQIATEYEIERYASKVQYIIHLSNKGGSAARNTGWRHAKGEYITFVDDDDELYPTKIEKQVHSLEIKSEDWGVSYTAYRILMSNGTVQYSSRGRKGDVYVQALARTLYMGSGSNMLIRKSVVDKINGYDESFKRNQDVEFMARLAECCKFEFVPDCLLTVHFEVRQFKRTFDFLDSVALYYIERFSDRLDKLSSEDRKKVLSIISLDRARVACNCKEYKAAKKILRDNNIGIVTSFRYMLYLVHRFVTKQSYGFYY